MTDVPPTTNPNHDLFTGSHGSPYLTVAMDNVLASRLGRICLDAASPEHSAGDYIDRGLILRRLLQEGGFSIVVTP